MRPIHSATAVAMLIVASWALAAPGAADHAPAFEWASPTEGGTIEASDNVSFWYRSHLNVTRAWGNVTLDGTNVGTFDRILEANTANGTLIVVKINASGFAAGNHTLGAIVHTLIETQRAPDITVQLVVPPPPPPPPPPPTPTLSWVYHNESGVLEQQRPVHLRYENGSMYAQDVAGFVTIDDKIAATFIVPAWSGTAYISVELNENLTTLGSHVLNATAWTRYDEAVDAVPRVVEIVPFNPAPTLRNVTATWDAASLEVVVSGFVNETPDDQVARFDVLTQWGNRNLSSPDGPFEVRIPPPRPIQPGWATVIVRAADDAGHSTTVYRAVQVLDAPADVRVDARHVPGLGFHVAGSATDANGRIELVEIRTPHSVVVQKQPRENWSFNITEIPRLGENVLTVKLVDQHNGTTILNVTVDVQGRHIVFYDQAVQTTFGQHTDVDLFSVPPRVVSGSVRICTYQPCGNYSTLNAEIVVASVPNGPLGQAPFACKSGRTCAFETSHWSRNFEVTWVQGPFTRASVLVEGYVV